MNKRIQQLAEQASEIDGDDLLYYHPVFAEKFAELIVGECKNLLFESSENNRLPIAVDDMVHIIDTHFGVEECNN